jgi:glycosyltransferase involved in cell wall biosynthesis
MSARTLCLNMIVRNEADVLSRALLSVADHIAYWVICDTGSTDRTKELVQSIFAARGIPGELHGFGFENFAQARNAALDRARASAGGFDYLVLMDADMELVVDDPTFRQRLTAPSYRVRQKAGISYWNTRLLRRDASARYHGVTHEYVDRLPDEAALESIWFVDHADGGNRPGKLDRDIRLLQEGLVSEPQNSRYAFYLAQTYRDAGRLRDAADAYARRVNMTGWDEETWYAQLQEARCRLELGDDADFVATASKAFDRRPHRAEPLYDLARFYRLRNLNEMAMTFGQVAAKLPWPKDDSLFIEDFVYAVGIREEISISGFYCKSTEHQEAGRRACYDLAVDRRAPESSRSLARHNQTFYAQAATSLLPSLDTWPLTFETPAAGNLTNPSVAIWNGAVYVLVRSVNYRISDSGHYEIQNNGPIETRNYLLRLDSALKPDAWSEILPPSDLPPPRYSLVRGFEDARVFAWRDSLWCSSTVRELTAEGWCEIVLAKIDGPLTPSCRLAQWRVLEPEGPRRHQKNWMPQVSGSALRFIYSADPTRVVDECGRTISEKPPVPALDHLRGGSNAIAFDGGWLTLTHEVSHFNQQPVYLHRFVWFDEAMELKSTTAPFYFVRRGIEFAAGLAWHPHGRRLIVTFGVNDAEARVGTVLADDVRTALTDGGHADGRSLSAVADGVPAGAKPSLSAPREKSAPSTFTFVTCLFDLPPVRSPEVGQQTECHVAAQNVAGRRRIFFAGKGGAAAAGSFGDLYGRASVE